MVYYTLALSIRGLDNIVRGKAMNGTKRSDIRMGTRVSIVRKEDQKTGALTKGIVKDILTKSSNHPHGIKVRLESGEVGRVKDILES